MVRCILLTTFAFLLLPCASFAGVDDEVRVGLKTGTFKATRERTTSDISAIADLVILSTTEGPTTVKPGAVKYFRINKINAFTKDGGWYWKAAGSPGKTQLKGADYIMVGRDFKGKVTWTMIVKTRP
jgi:hypothetical protein